MPVRGAVSGCSPPVWSWLHDLGDGVNCLFFFLNFWKSMVIAGKLLEWIKKKVPCSTVAGLAGEFHSAFRNIIPVTTPIELRRLLMLPRRKERGETSPKILLNCWVAVVKIPLCSVGWGRGELKENWIMLEVNRKVLLEWRIGMSQETP